MAAGSPTLWSQEAPAAAKAALPSAESILDKHIEASGGKEAYKKMKNAVLKGSMDIMGMRAEVTIYKAEPNLTLTEVNIPEMGKMLEGFDGKNGWSYNPMQGPSIKQGREADEAKTGADFREEEWKNRYSKVETVGIETVAGEECYKVALTHKSGMAMTNFYSKKSGLLIRTDATAFTAMGEIEGQVVFKDYKKVGDLVLMPFQIVNSAAGMSMTMTFSEIKINVDLPKSTFEPPAEVKALISK
jgi:outer membrane lipoprotein-sorting protein